LLLPEQRGRAETRDDPFGQLPANGAGQTKETVMTLARSFAVLAFFSLFAPCSDPYSGGAHASTLAHKQRCRSNADCGQLEFCDTEASQTCGGVGVCTPRGVNLFCPNIWIGVCGCDGVTYGNTCLMHKAGVSEASAGSCAPAPEPCLTNYDCDDTQYCKTAPGECGGVGTCESRGINLFCVQSYQPVCGCDGMTYANSCQAMKHGAAVDHAGVCE
jgi:hypothetical protein